MSEVPVIKPLEWDGVLRSGDYRVTASLGQGPKPLFLSRGSRVLSWHDTPEEAKAAAQADHEAHIRAFIGEALPRDVRKWAYYPIEMPVTKDGKGPAKVGQDADAVSYEVWDWLFNSHASFDNLPDAINEAMRLTLERGFTYAEAEGGQDAEA